MVVSDFLMLGLYFIVPMCSIRSPGPVTPRDVDCEDFSITYTRIDKSSSAPQSSHSLENDVDQKVDDAIESFLRNLSQIGPELLSVSRNERSILL